MHKKFNKFRIPTSGDIVIFNFRFYKFLVIEPEFKINKKKEISPTLVDKVINNLNWKIKYQTTGLIRP